MFVVLLGTHISVKQFRRINDSDKTEVDIVNKIFKSSEQHLRTLIVDIVDTHPALFCISKQKAYISFGHVHPL